ncbi:hypothetical protein T2_00036 [Ralstonia phage Elie]|uniref:Uncharacterized protein n=4 Tax=Bakolyvirus TaxID=2843355 RepID=A0A7G5BBR5_9CAUD|nr:hypothetical protein KE332_gp36 [Ralstonia phage Adzire]YP_010052771.1 hypothetical protein KE333_gp22 [Ralstonia phage Bakoly]YP_010077723.1 hypothetical protein KMC38_gp36 [Ralstonia phage Simangalove]QMV32981.1 hypothetical protein T2_00036 [Ralstonia phage Elie]QMV33548.1 hypothetical protein 30B_00041 [Ralstonia phage Jenny]QMV33693.1 hypothetical protein S3_00049 [Ralstonia phage Sarlave]QMV32353.1 hypothetical protein S1_00036 [Ralstonia phage Adzire]QMV32595.1 hypothetical protein
MLKTIDIALAGRDADRIVTLTELPALRADTWARAALRALDQDPDDGVVGLALEHSNKAQNNEQARTAARALIRARIGTRPLDLNTLRDWRSIFALQDAAFVLHAGFVVGRKPTELPITFQALMMGESDDLRPSFCSPLVATVLQSGRASYHELDTVLSTEDAFNIVELINLDAYHRWRAAQDTKTT